MNFDYSRSAATALRMLAKFGQKMTVKSSTDGTYNPDSGEVEGSVDATQTGDGVIFPYKLSEVNKEGSLIRMDDQQVLIKLATKPAPNDKLTVGDKTYTIISMQVLAPAGTTILYKLQVRA